VATLTAAAVAVLALLVFLLFGVVVELCRDVRQLREAAGILDRPLEVELEDVAGAKPSSFGLPRELDSVGSAVVLFLSDRCATCHSLAEGFAGTLPTGLWLVLEAKNPGSAEDFLASYGLTAETTGRRLTVDAAGEIARRLGLRTTPVGFRLHDGRFTSATTVPSRRYLSSIVPDRVRLERSVHSPLNERKAS
jgi:hypothetical protein